MKIGPRVAAPLCNAALRRLGHMAIGRSFAADLAIADIAFYPWAAGSIQTWNRR